MDKSTISKKIQPLTAILHSYKEIIWFLCLFLLFEAIWKVAVHQGDDESILLVFGKDLTSYTTGICLWTAKATHWLVQSVFGYSDFRIEGTHIFFPRSLRIDVIWGCTGLKQLFMFSFILIFYPGPLRKKLWYLPMSLVILTLVNMLRLGVICIIIKDSFPDWFISFNEWYNNRTWEYSNEMYWVFYKDWFNLFHRDILTWLYYDGVVFILWLIWEEKINKKYVQLKAKVSQVANGSTQINLET